MKKDAKKEKLRLKEFMKINKHNLSEDLRRNPSLMFRLGCLKNDAETYMSKTENDYEITKSVVYRKLKKKMSGATETEIKHRLNVHPEVKKAYSDFLDAKHMFNMYKVAVKSIDDKSTQLTNLSYNYRKELDHNIVKKSREKNAMDKVNKSFKGEK